MTSTAQTAGRTFQNALSTSKAATIRSTMHHRQPIAQRFFSSSSRKHNSSAFSLRSNITTLSTVTVASALFGAGVYYTTLSYQPNFSILSIAIPESVKASSKADSTTITPFVPTFADYQRVYDAIAKRLWDESEYDDGSYGPVVLRLGWHSSGTYDAATNTGGSNGGLMRHPTGESTHGANKGLINAVTFLAPIEAQFPWLSHGDLYTLAASCAIQEMAGPTIPWRPGRQDLPASSAAPEGRLPDGRKASEEIRRVFGRMGFDDREMVALSGAHAVGRCHVKNSGFEGPWTFSPTMMTNDYFRLLVEETWGWKDWDGEKQWEDKTTGSLMMLPTDMALVEDENFRPWVERYAKDQDLFFNDFRDVMVKLFELGVPFQQEERFTFKSTLE